MVNIPSSPDLPDFIPKLKIRDLKGELRSEAEDILEQFSEVSTATLSKNSTIESMVKLSAKLNKKSKGHKKLKNKVENFVMMANALKRENVVVAVATTRNEERRFRPPTQEIEARRMLLGRFEIHEILKDNGQMGTTYKVWDNEKISLQ